MKISVITTTIRPLGLKLLKQALTYQDFKDYEWIICSPKKMEKEIIKNNEIKDEIHHLRELLLSI